MRSLIKEVFPNALIVIDRFHVIKLVNKSLNKIRLFLELKGLKNYCLLLKNGTDLTEEEEPELELLLNRSPCLAIVYELKEELRKIYETGKTVKMGLRRLQKWLVSAQCLLGQTTETLERHIQEICHYFMQRTTSGVRSGINKSQEEEIPFVRTRDGRIAYVLAIFAEDASYAKNGQIFPQISRQVFDRLNR